MIKFVRSGRARWRRTAVLRECLWRCTVHVRAARRWEHAPAAGLSSARASSPVCSRGRQGEPARRARLQPLFTHGGSAPAGESAAAALRVARRAMCSRRACVARPWRPEAIVLTFLRLSDLICPLRHTRSWRAELRGRPCVALRWVWEGVCRRARSVRILHWKEEFSCNSLCSNVF